MHSKLAFLTFLLLFIVFLASSASASLSSSTFTYQVGDSSLSASILSTTNRCLTSNGNSTIYVRVLKTPTNTADLNAVITATILKPDSNSVSVSFTNQLDGNYTNVFNYDKNGTYRIDITVTDNNNGLGSTTLTDYIYAVDFDINISFLNNNASYTAGQTGTVRNYVTNKDGNFFNDLNGSTTIYYPDSTVFLSNQTMSSQGSGEYLYTFTVPSTEGTYSESSTFACANKSDTNTQGRFTVPTSGGGGNNNNGGGGATGGGGGGGGGGGQIIEAKVTDVLISPLQILRPGTIQAIIVNNGISSFDGIVRVRIIQDSTTEYNEVSDVFTLKGHKSASIQLPKTWTPASAGTHNIIVELLTTHNQLIDKKEKEIVLVGKRDYSLSAVCQQPLRTFNVPIDFNILVENKGDYSDMLNAEWDITDKTGAKIFSGNFPITPQPRERINLVLSKIIPSGNQTGIYEFNTHLKFDGTFADDSCTFMIEEPCTYYSKVIKGLKDDLNVLDKQLASKGDQGEVSAFIKNRINALRQKVQTIDDSVIAGTCTGHDEELDAAQRELDELRVLLAGISERAFLRTQSLANILLALALLTIIIALFFNTSRKEYYLEITRQQEKFDEALGLKNTGEWKDRVKKNSELNILLGLSQFGKKIRGKK